MPMRPAALATQMSCTTPAAATLQASAWPAVRVAVAKPTIAMIMQMFRRIGAAAVTANRMKVLRMPE